MHMLKSSAFRFAIPQMCSKFFFFSILQGEMISFPQETRIPASECVNRYCYKRDIKTLLRSGKHGKHHLYERITESKVVTGDVAKALRNCDSERNQGRNVKAYHSVIFGNETVLTFLFPGRALCGKSILLKLQINSIRSKSLLLEEGLRL